MKRIIGVIFYFLACVTAQAGVPCALPFTLTQGTVANATEVMANYNAIITCLTNAAAAGANNDITALNGLLTPITPAQGGTNVFIGGTSGGTANAQTLATTTPNTFTLTQGYTVVFRVGVTNTGPMTMTIGSLGAVNVFRTAPSGAQAMTGGEMNAGNIAAIQYDGTQFQLLTSSNQLGGYGPVTDLASALGVLDLGTVGSHDVKVTDVGTTITSFGASAVVDYPVYIVKFDNTVTLVNNVVSLQLPSSANIVTAAGDTLVARYLGTGNWRVQSYSRFNGTSVVTPTPLCGANGVTMTNNAVTPDTSYDYTAASAVLINASNIPIYVTGISGTLNLTTGTAGVPVANGMDGNPRPTSNQGYVYLISNGTTTAAVVTPNATAPALPAGYTYYCRIGAAMFDAGQRLYRQRQRGRTSRYIVTAGSASTTRYPGILATSLQTWPVSQTTSGFFPATATRIGILIYCDTNCGITVGTSISTSAINGPTAPLSSVNPPDCARSDLNSASSICELDVPGSGSFFVGAANAGAWSISAYGWTDSVNAN